MPKLASEFLAGGLADGSDGRAFSTQNDLFLAFAFNVDGLLDAYRTVL